ncbi:hypothetical protein PSEEN1496 [Pseudomonas entomophila L48]|uniref:Uncharacterized protein n=1 Tax=Pseudomonas entomophila (strain L48) TaxID=384676 RepID=Q1ID95_PSEE4|nr:hypothetical protein PSEEN1496 [Pseudomonas entomophila L48]
MLDCGSGIECLQSLQFLSVSPSEVVVMAREDESDTHFLKSYSIGPHLSE